MIDEILKILAIADLLIVIDVLVYLLYREIKK